MAADDLYPHTAHGFDTGGDTDRTGGLQSSPHSLVRGLARARSLLEGMDNPGAYVTVRVPYRLQVYARR